MRIGINLLAILPGINGGIETYAVSTLRALAARDLSTEYVVFVNRHGAQMPVLTAPNITPVVCDFDAYSRELRYAWEHLLLPFQVRKHRVDMLHSPAYQGPWHCHCPSVVTLPDLNFIEFRDVLPFRKRVALQFFCSNAARHAERVITISEFSKQQIVEHLGIPKDNISVIHLGPGIFTPPAPWDLVRARHGLDGPYVVVFAGNNYPHKNLPRLFEAFTRVRTYEPVRLAVIGRLSSELRQAGEALRDRLLELGYVDDSHIAPILGHARLCVVPSYYEGFGIPLLEAHNAGVPLVCSKAASIPEVAGRAAVYFDPYSVDEMAAAIQYCLDDPEHCASLVRAGFENARRFSWEKAAEETLGVYNEVLHASTAVEIARGAG